MAHFSEFKPREKGLSKVLGDLEADIMNVVWPEGRYTVREVHEHLRKNKDLAYTTVMTVMSRLATKGLLRRDMIDGAYFYEPAVSQEQFNANVATQVLDGLMESFREQTISHLVDRASNEDLDVLERLAKAVAERRKKEK